MENEKRQTPESFLDGIELSLKYETFQNYFIWWDIDIVSNCWILVKILWMKYQCCGFKWLMYIGFVASLIIAIDLEQLEGENIWV